MTARPLRGDEAELFRQYSERLIRSVGRTIGAPHALIEDACAVAWTQLVRTQPERGPRLFAWLRKVAIHEAYRLSREERREIALEELTAHTEDDGSTCEGWETQVPGPDDVEATVEAQEALAVLAELPERQRRYLALQVAGYRYLEIVRLTGATYTNVNKHLVRAHASVRAAREAA
ncbi:MAG: RNA polymerase sigma factor [Gaiellaceae bacterium]